MKECKWGIINYNTNIFKTYNFRVQCFQKQGEYLVSLWEISIRHQLISIAILSYHLRANRMTQLTLHVILTVRFMLSLTFQGPHKGLPLEQLKIESKEICFWTTNCCTWVCISTLETQSSRARCRHTRSLQTTSAKQGVTVTWCNSGRGLNEFCFCVQPFTKILIA